MIEIYGLWKKMFLLVYFLSWPANGRRVKKLIMNPACQLFSVTVSWWPKPTTSRMCINKSHVLFKISCGPPLCNNLQLTTFAVNVTQLHLLQERLHLVMNRKKRFTWQFVKGSKTTPHAKTIGRKMVAFKTNLSTPKQSVDLFWHFFLS